MKRLKKMMLMLLCSLVGVLALSITAMAKDADGDTVVVIDAGHGGTDPGKIATTGAYESAINLQIALAMRDELKQYDHLKVYITRSNDEWLTNTGRSMVAKAMHADFLISVHNNSAESTESSGSLVIRTINQYYAEQTNDMAIMILDSLAELGLVNNGVMTRPDDKHTNEDYYTLIGEGVRAGVPSVIIEHCFLSNPNDAAFVSYEDGSVNLENCQRLGVADANAVVRYFNLTKRSKVADSTSVCKLAKGYRVAVTTPDGETEGVTWYSIDSSIATVDENGVATAENSGTTNIVYKKANGDTGYLTLEVAKTEALALVGAINPTFYDDATNYFANIDLRQAFAFVIYNDATTSKVTPTSYGTVDYNQIGIQDIPIVYDSLNGSIRVCHNTNDYIPVVTEAPVETQPETTQPQTAAPETESETQSEAEEPGIDIHIPLTPKAIIIYVIILIGLIAIGIFIAIYERKNKRRRGRRYY